MSRAHWFALANLPGVGAATARKLLERFDGVEAIFAASPEELARVPRLSPALTERLLATPLDALSDELDTLEAEGIGLLTWDDERFPAALRTLPAGPLVLYHRGTLSADDERAVAIVGTRAPSPAGLEVARRIGRVLAEYGLTVVSGLALGVDTAAHQGALEALNGRTVAVLGSGLRVIHPRANAVLAERIAERGALLSELHPNTRPRGTHLMARDRLVSGLSRAVIVVEAGLDSGSLDTAARAAKQGRLVFAAPGSPGTDRLLTAGARPIELKNPDLESLAKLIVAHRSTTVQSRQSAQPTLW